MVAWNAWWPAYTAVAGQPIDLVNDAVGGVVGLDVLDHPHQFGAASHACGLARVNELLHDDRVEFAGLAQVGLALRGVSVTIRIHESGCAPHQGTALLFGRGCR